MTDTFFVFFQWLHDVLSLFQSELSPPTRFITPDSGNVTLKYHASNILEGGDDGRELVYSIVRQYTQEGDERTRQKELANFQNAEQHLLRMLRGPFDFHRFRGTTLLFALSPASTPFQVVEKAIRFVCTKLSSSLTYSCMNLSTCRNP
jgi:hypothetical protein